MFLKVGTNGEKKDRFFQSICPVSLSTAAYIDLLYLVQQQHSEQYRAQQGQIS